MKYLDRSDIAFVHICQCIDSDDLETLLEINKIFNKNEFEDTQVLYKKTTYKDKYIVQRTTACALHFVFK